MKNLPHLAVLPLLCNVLFAAPVPVDHENPTPLGTDAETFDIAFGTFNLVDSTDDTIISTISDGDVFYLDVVGDSLNIQAVPSQSVGSVRFTTDDGYGLTEGVAPYAYKGDISGDYNDWVPSEGTVLFTVKYYSGSGGTGTLLATDTFSITFAATASPPSGGGYWDRSASNIHYTDGNVGIGTTDPGSYKLAVNGKVHAKEVKVDMDGWADYVFERDYDLPTLEEVERHIRDRGHLMNVPSAAEVARNGIELGEMDRVLLEKIEELTLYILEQEKNLKQMERRLNDLAIMHTHISKN